MSGSFLCDESGEDKYFGRSDRAFFHHPGTKEAITTLAQADSLVIYCGSGVTIDRTGATWGKLISDLLRGYANGNAEMLADIAVLADKMDPPQLGSILYEQRLRGMADKKRVMQSFAAKLHPILYEGKDWEAGFLVRNIIRLAAAFLRLKKRVVLVTSNYDDYLESEYWAYKQQTGEIAPDGVAVTGYPGLRVTAIGDPAGAVSEPSVPRSLPQLRIIYIHGRVSRGLAVRGHLVLSEQDYNTSRGKVVTELSRLFRQEGCGVLIVGSSLTDAPLLAALTDTIPSEIRRYALLPAESTGMTDVPPEQFKRVQGFLSRRGDHFGMEILMPDFHYQIAQFCFEVLMACDDAEYASDERNVRYGKRLLRWWKSWEAQDTESAADATHRSLLDALRELEGTFLGSRGERVRDDKERFKLELWVRYSPEEFRGLVLWASSSGTLHDRRILRHEKLTLFSQNASVRAFAEGRPQYVSRMELLAKDPRAANGSEGTRWNSFLSVPIRLDILKSGDLVELPVGVLTLASTKNKGRNSMIPADETTQMAGLVKRLEDLGKDLLRV